MALSHRVAGKLLLISEISAISSATCCMMAYTMCFVCSAALLVMLLQTGDKMAFRPPVAGKSSEQDQRGDMVAGINK
jgi:hypothetical protein